MPPVSPVVRHYQPPQGVQEALMAATLRMALRLSLKPFLGPPWPFAVQRAAIEIGATFMPQDRRVQVQAAHIAHIPVERITVKGGAPGRHAVLYLHGGAFVAGSPRSHRSITRRLAALTGAQVLVPHYRLAPEAPFPAQIDDCVQAYRQLLAEGYAPERIAVAGDSAGGNLTFMLSAALTAQGLPQPACLVMMSPVFSLRPIPGGKGHLMARTDPMIRMDWAADAERALRIPVEHPLADAMAQDLSQLPPSLLQVGEQEVLIDSAEWLSKAAALAGRVCELEVYLQRWHVFQLHAGLMPSADRALERQVAFMQRHWAV